MTTLRQIIIDAFREGNLIASGETPDADQFDEGLRKLQRIITGTYGYVIGERLQPLNFGSLGLTNAYAKREDYDDFITSSYVPSNVRLMLNNEGVTTVFLPPKPMDGAMFGVVDVAGNLATNTLTVNGNGRAIEGGSSLLLDTNNLRKDWFYREDLGDWVAISDLDADSLVPFPEEFDDYFITMLAMRIAPQFGIETRQETMTYLMNLRSRLRSRYTQGRTVEPPLALERMDGTTFGFYDKDFEYGYVR